MVKNLSPLKGKFHGRSKMENDTTLISIFCDVDDFCNEFEPEWRKIFIEHQNKQLIGDKKRRNRRTELSLSEAMTIIINASFG